MWLVASGKDLGDPNQIVFGRTCSEVAAFIHGGNLPVVSLLEKFTANPTQTRHEIRLKLGLLDKLAAELFAISVFFCDDLLQISHTSINSTTLTSSNPPAVRFFSIVQRLPIELQMILCHQVYGSTRQNILHKESEFAFISLARILPPILVSTESLTPTNSLSGAHPGRSLFYLGIIVLACGVLAARFYR